MAALYCLCNHNHSYQKHKPYITPHHEVEQFDVVFINYVGGGGGGGGKFVGRGGGGGAPCPLPGKGGQ